MPTRRDLIALLALGLFASGCARYVGRAKRAYAQGRYLEAAEQLAEHEAEVYDLAPRKQADYGIYRGLSLLMLGDLPNAHRWLWFAYEVERHNPGTLTPEQRASLHGGFWELQRRMGVEVPAPPHGGAPTARPASPPPEEPPTEL